MAAADRDPCAICRDACTDIFITDCHHVFCGRCICTVLQRAVTGFHGRASQACPVCRHTVAACTTTSVPDASMPFLKLHLGKVLVTVNVPAGMQPITRLCKLFGVEPNSVKFIHKGRRVVAEELMDVAASGGSITCLPTKMPKQSTRERACHAVAMLVLWAHAWWSASPLAKAVKSAIRRSIPTIAVAYNVTLAPLVSLLCVIGASLHPSFNLQAQTQVQAARPREAAGTVGDRPNGAGR